MLGVMTSVCVCVCGFSFSSKLCREEVEQLRREVDLLKSKLSELRAVALCALCLRRTL